MQIGGSCAAFVLIILPTTDSAPSDAEMDMDAFNEDFKVSSKGKLKSYEIDYESLTQGAVEMLMQADIEHISGILGVDVSLNPPPPSCLFY